MALTKLTSNLIEGGTGTDWVTAIQTSNFTAAAGKGYFVNTTSQVLYVNLPVGVVGMEITIQDYAGTFGTNKVILNANGSEKIQGSALEGRINTNNATAVLIYQDATKGWTSQDVTLNVTEISWATPTGQSLTYSTPSPQSSQGATAATFPTTTFTATLAGSIISGTATIAGLPSGITATQTITGSGAGNTLTVTLTGTFPSTDSLNTALTLSGLTLEALLTVDYLVVAGGGGGGGAGGGGAGGLLTGTHYFSSATNYLLTLGAGGPGATIGNGTQGTNGNNVSLATVGAAIGGGGGGAFGYGTPGSGNGKTGGSGGGGGFEAGVTPTGGSGTSGQGNAGGTTVRTVANPYTSSGGGGAGAAGSSDSGGNSGNGGIGVASSINGTSYYWAGGGGGGAQGSGTVAGNGGNGGGGGGANYNQSGGTGTGGAGLNAGGNGGCCVSSAIGGAGGGNTGGGGGGMGVSVQTGGAGGSGIVILRYPNSKTITNPGAGLTFTTATVSTDKVTTFTAGTGNIQFN